MPETNVPTMMVAFMLALASREMDELSNVEDVVFVGHWIDMLNRLVSQKVDRLRPSGIAHIEGVQIIRSLTCHIYCTHMCTKKKEQVSVSSAMPIKERD